MSEEDRGAFLEEKARKEAEELAAAQAKARAEETKDEAVSSKPGPRFVYSTVAPVVDTKTRVCT